MNMNKKLLFVALALSLGLSSKAQVDLVPDTIPVYNEADFINTFKVGQPKVTETIEPGRRTVRATFEPFNEGSNSNVMDVPTSDFTRSLNYFIEKFTGVDNDYNRSLLLVMNDFLVENLRETPEEIIDVEHARRAYDTPYADKVHKVNRTKYIERAKIAETVLYSMRQKAMEKRLNMTSNSLSPTMERLLKGNEKVVANTYAPEVVAQVKMICSNYLKETYTKTQENLLVRLGAYLDDEIRANHISRLAVQDIINELDTLKNRTSFNKLRDKIYDIILSVNEASVNM